MGLIKAAIGAVGSTLHDRHTYETSNNRHWRYH